MDRGAVELLLWACSVHACECMLERERGRESKFFNDYGTGVRGNTTSLSFITRLHTKTRTMCSVFQGTTTTRHRQKANFYWGLWSCTVQQSMLLIHWGKSVMETESFSKLLHWEMLGKKKQRKKKQETCILIFCLHSKLYVWFFTLMVQYVYSCPPAQLCCERRCRWCQHKALDQALWRDPLFHLSWWCASLKIDAKQSRTSCRKHFKKLRT